MGTAAAGMSFLFKAFPYTPHSFQIVAPEGKSKRPMFSSDPEQACKETLAANKDGYDIYFMVNEGDGKTRGKDGVVRLSKCFIDADGCSLETITDYLTSINLTPHLTIESSPGRFHLYFFFDAVDKTDTTIAKWKATQEMLMRLGDPKGNPSTLGLDRTMIDYSKVLRVPGFLHIKKRSTVKIHSDNTHLSNYTLDHLFTITNAASRFSLTKEERNDRPPEFDLDNPTVIEESNRFNALQSEAMRIARLGLRPADSKALFTGYALKKISSKNPEYVCNNELTPRCIKLIEDAIADVEKERITVIQDSLDRVRAIKSSRSLWVLPDEFLLAAPNGFGEVVKECMKYSTYPCATLSFATFLTGLSVIKAKRFFTPSTSSCVLYTLLVAPPGYGKQAPTDILANTFEHYNYGKLDFDVIRSKEGLIKQLHAHNSSGLFMPNEIGMYLAELQKKTANYTFQAVNDAIKTFYTNGTRKKFSEGKLAESDTKKGAKEVELSYPALGICGSTTRAVFDNVFVPESVSDGLCARFTPFVVELAHTKKNRNADSQAHIKSDLFNFIDTSSPADPDPAPVKIPCTPQAYAYLNDMADEARLQYERVVMNPETEHMAGLYSRNAEQAERVATVLADREITLEVAEYAFKLIDCIHRARVAAADTTIFRDAPGSAALRKENIIIETIAKLCEEQNSTMVYRSAVFGRCRRSFDEKDQTRDFDRSLAILIELGKVVKDDKFKRMGTNARPGVGIALGNILE